MYLVCIPNPLCTSSLHSKHLTYFTIESHIPITVRQLEAIIRISEALAKMTLSNTVNVEHVREAHRLFQVII